ncbi:SEL1-like repeat protein [Parvularcula marina]|jgi:TPR repeat protein|nr:SEL1-like repeat protein [Parvularcula marina]
MGSKRFAPRNALLAGVSLAVAGIFTPAFADFDDALRAYSYHPNGQIDQAKVLEALDLWRKYAIAGDVQSRQVLGDVYSNQSVNGCSSDSRDLAGPKPVDTGVIQEDKVRALAWYTIAATHDFEDYSQKPDFCEINARARAQTRVPQLKSVMTTEQVEKAEDLVVTLLSSESEFDLYRLGVMYQTGNGMPKNNVEALTYYNLASSRALNANPNAVKAASFLKTIMTREEIEEADKKAREWQPPLHDAFQGPSPIAVDIENQTKVLQARRTALAIAEIEANFAEGNEHLVQGALAALGLYLDDIDGTRGPKTIAAIKRFQYNLVEDDENLSEEQKRDSMTGVLTPPQKVKLIERAASVNHPQSQYIYGVMYAEGIGVPVNGEQSVRWLKKSASFGYPLAHFALGKYYRQGIYGDDPIEPSRSEAAHHLGQAVALGYKPAEKALEELYTYDYAQ